MSRPVTTLAVFFAAMNSIARILRETGIATTLHIQASIGSNQEIANVAGQSELSTGTPTGSTLFGMYNVLAGQLEALYGGLFPGLVMLQHAGLPSFLTQYLLAPLVSLTVLIAMISFLRGFNL